MRSRFLALGLVLVLTSAAAGQGGLKPKPVSGINQTTYPVADRAPGLAGSPFASAPTGSPFAGGVPGATQTVPTMSTAAQFSMNNGPLGRTNGFGGLGGLNSNNMLGGMGAPLGNSLGSPYLNNPLANNPYNSSALIGPVSNAYMNNMFTNPMLNAMYGGMYNPMLNPYAAAYHNPYMANPYMANPYMANPYMANPYMANPYMANPYLANPLLQNPLVTNPLLAGNPLLGNPLLGGNPFQGHPLLGNQTPAMGQQPARQ
jgi:hypothetical protein